MGFIWSPDRAASSKLHRLPVGAYRSRGLRLVLGTTVLGVAGGAAWLVNALKQRVAFYERCQSQEEQL